VFARVTLALVQVFITALAGVARVAAALEARHTVHAASIGAARSRGALVRVHVAPLPRPAGGARTAESVEEVLAPPAVLARVGRAHRRAPAAQRDLLLVARQVELGRLRGPAVIREGQVHAAHAHRAQAARKALATDGHLRRPVTQEAEAPAALEHTAAVSDPVHGDDPGRDGRCRCHLGHRHGDAMPPAVSHTAGAGEHQGLHAVACLDLHTDGGVAQAHRQQVGAPVGAQDHGVAGARPQLQVDSGHRPGQGALGAVADRAAVVVKGGVVDA